MCLSGPSCTLRICTTFNYDLTVALDKLVMLFIRICNLSGNSSVKVRQLYSVLPGIWATFHIHSDNDMTIFLPLESPWTYNDGLWKLIRFFIESEIVTYINYVELMLGIDIECADWTGQNDFRRCRLVHGHRIFKLAKPCNIMIISAEFHLK